MKRLRPIMLVLALLATVMAGCSDDDDDGTTPGPSLQVQIQATPAEAQTGGTIGLSATVSNTKVDYAYTWSATGGTFTATNAPATNWTAPDEDGTYEITCVVTDGSTAAVAKAPIVVMEYLPAASPHFVGAATCNGCHDDKYATWEATGHSGALVSLDEIGQGGNAECLACHTVGFDAAADNGGYDEQKVERLAGVQCENCHGPGSDHRNSPAGGLPEDLSSGLCGSCHNGSHHPTFDEWQESGHGNYPPLSPAGRTSCARCHNGSWAMEYLDDPLHDFTGEAITDTLSINCATCHDPHGNDNLANLRNAVLDIALPDGEHPAAGAGRLCIACHNGRRGPESIEDMVQNGSEHFGPHHSVQGEMLTGTGAYELVNPDFVFRTSNHIKIQDGCVNCHTHAHPGAEVNYTGHNFTPTVEACTPCHGPIQQFTEIMAKDDYDGDLEVEGVQGEIEGLLHNLAVSLIESGATGEIRTELQTAYDGGTFDAAIGDTLLTTVDMRKAGYNYFFVEFDQSRGVHNATYAIQLLQQSILALQPGALKTAKVLIE